MRNTPKRSLGTLFSAITLTALATPSYAGQEYVQPYYDEARVIAVSPQVERVNEPRQECRTEYVRETYGSASNERSVTGSIIGGIAGGLLGSQIGRGNGRVAAAAVGAGVGAVVGDRVGNQSTGTNTVERPIERCVMVDNWHTVERGYLVTYRYNGRDYSTVTHYRPGDTIRVRVAVEPADDVVSYAPPVSRPVVYSPPPSERGYGRSGHRREYW